MLYGNVNAMCDIATLASKPHGIGHSAGNALVGATGASTASYGEVATTVRLCRSPNVS